MDNEYMTRADYIEIVEKLERENALLRTRLEKLVELPLSIGDKVFSFDWSIKNDKFFIRAGVAKEIRYSASDKSIMVSDGEMFNVWNKRIFLTLAEAEKALKEMEGN